MVKVAFYNVLGNRSKHKYEASNQSKPEDEAYSTVGSFRENRSLIRRRGWEHREEAQLERLTCFATGETREDIPYSSIPKIALLFLG
jgi:hypothetical protein